MSRTLLRSKKLHRWLKSVEIKISFTLKVLPQIVHFDFGDEEINSMDMVSASCTVNKGDLPINIFWTRNKQKIFSNDGISISRTNKRMSVLSIESVRDRHSGEYTCVAENEAGVVQHSAVLSVNGIFLPFFTSSS